ncbi:hypothetical protein BD289DRAFT_482897 [Coniella lustricola]|uniref:Uncharacterized protein n=1 Tax=Coniella lustricola TaxID=2025994 RepID=A0A2T3A789_9PEZI|nr:hypothetical protein BD289DRAFT_482897 [Coniella lustricola]
MASSAGWFSLRRIELIQPRSLLLRVWPPPITLSERRAVLQALQRYGEIEVFKRLPEANTFICAPATSKIANQLVELSPLVFKHISNPLHSIIDQPTDDAKPFDIAAPVEVHMVEKDTQEEQEAQQRRIPKDFAADPIKTFEVKINLSQDNYSHKRAIEWNPLHGPWPETSKEDQDFAYFALREVIPGSMAKEGLCDWNTGGQLNEDVKHMRSQEEVSHEWQIQQRKLRKQADRAFPVGSEEDELVLWSTTDQDQRRRQAEAARMELALQRGQPVKKEAVGRPDTLLGADLNSFEAMKEAARTQSPKKTKKHKGESFLSPNEFERALRAPERKPRRNRAPKRTILNEHALRMHYWAKDAIPMSGEIKYKSILNKDVEDKPFTIENFVTLPKKDMEPCAEKSLVRRGSLPRLPRRDNTETSRTEQG